MSVPFVTPESASNGDATPPRTSRVLVTAVVGLGVLFVGSSTAVLGQVIESALTGLVVAAALSLLNDDDPESLAAGSLLLAPAAASLTGDLIAIAGGPPVRALRAVALVVASFGVAACWTGIVGNRTLTVGASRFGYALLPLSLAALAAMVSNVGTDAAAAAGGPVLDALWRELVAPTAPAPRIADFLLLLAVGGFAVRAALERLPVAELASKRDTARRAAQVERTVDVLRTTYRVCAPAGLVLGVLHLAGAGPYGALPGGLVDLLAGVAKTEVLRVLLVAAAVAGSVAAVAVEAVLWARTAAASDVAPRVVPFASGVALIGGVWAFTDLVLGRVRSRIPSVAAPALEELVGVVGETPVALLVVAGTLVLFVALVGVLTLLGRWGFLTDRVAPVALASAGLFLAGTVSGMVGDGPLVVFGGVAAATVAWDLGEYGVGVAEGLGRRARSRQGELAHGLASVAVGAASVAAAFALLGVMRRTVPEASLVAAGASAAFVGTLLLLSRLR
ncbi:hypothetical protein G9464_11930 [Halostella sp. JP-L12]|uniref:DUF7519 family protein n=1 Tax=Halostella TaxID=1843185 RepID=UPI000EF7790F|nr:MULTISPECIES: hypothetical protein [Halostella]NHN48301.1 hypothetical protein [Halostella sp. JP-L12]